MMNRLIAVFTLAFAGLFSLGQAQFQGCPAVVVPADIATCDSCVTLTATPVSGYAPTDYTVSAIPYSPFPFNGGVPILVGIDDIFSDVISLPFPVCFYGNTYTECVIGSNGIVSFDLFNANQYNTYPIDNPVPDATVPDLLNCIMGPWHDIDPFVGGTLNWSVYGTAPCRVLVVNWNQIPMFQCNNLINTQQTCIYETTNVIETYLAEKPICPTWEDGAAIHAIQNQFGTAAVVVPGRNFPTQWGVTNDAQRWTPSGAPTFTVSWWQGATQLATVGTIQVCPPANTPITYTARVVYHNCNGDSVVVSDDVTVTTAGLSLSTTHVNVSCYGGNSGSASAVVSGSTNVTYQWSNFQNTATINNLAAGAYFVSVTETVANCVFLDTVYVTQPPLFDATISAHTNVSCNGGNNGSATVTTTGGTGLTPTFIWSPGGQVTPTASNLTSGSYTVTATDSLGCTDVSTILISQPTALSVAINPIQITCFGSDNGTLTAAVSGGTPGFTYLWSTSAVTPAISNLGPGTYSVTVNDANGCQTSGSYTLVEPVQVTLTTGSTPETCAGLNNGTASASGAGGTGVFFYNWNVPPPNNTATIQGLIGGTYNVTVTDGNGCPATGSVVVGQNPSPVADAGQAVGFCDGTGGTQLFGSATGGTTPYYYTWTCAIGPCALDSVFDNDPIAAPDATQMYYFQVTDFNGCLSPVDSVLVTVFPLPVVNAGPDQHICQQPAPGAFLQPSISNAPGPFTFQWLPATGLNDPTLLSPFARPDSTTIYFLIATSSNGCTSQFNTTDTLSSVTVVVEPLPIAVAGGDRVVCFADTIMLQGYGIGAGPAYDFQWSPASGLSNPNIANPIASPSATTDFVLTVWSNGCPSIGDTMTVTVLTLPTVDAGPNRDVCAGGSVQLDAQAGGLSGNPVFTYQWSPPNDLSSATAEDPIAFPPFTSMYYVYAESPDGCRSPLDSVIVTIRETPVAEAGTVIIWCKDDDGTPLNGSLSWYDNNPPANPGAAVFSWEPSQFIVGANDVLNPVADPPTTMFFYLTITFDSCSTTDSVLVTVLNEVLSGISADTTTICSGDSLLLTASGGLGGATYNWIPATGLSDPTAANPFASPQDTTTYSVIVSEAGCSDTSTVTLNVIPTPQTAFLSSLTEGCEDFPVSFLNTTENALLLTWHFGDGTMSNETNPMHVYTEPGSYIVSLGTVNTGGCKDGGMQVTITVHPEFTVDFTSDPGYPAELVLPNATVSFHPVSGLGVDYLWNFGDGIQSTEANPVHEFTEVGTYEVSLRSRNEIGCISEVKHGPYVVLSPDLMIPNVFSPNDDNINDEFWVKYTGTQPLLLQVYDRWGNLLYESRDKYAGWNGSFGTEPAPAGVYFYVVTVAEKVYNGSVTLVR